MRSMPSLVLLSLPTFLKGVSPPRAASDRSPDSSTDSRSGCRSVWRRQYAQLHGGPGDQHRIPPPPLAVVYGSKTFDGMCQRMPEAEFAAVLDSRSSRFDDVSLTRSQPKRRPDNRSVSVRSASKVVCSIRPNRSASAMIAALTTSAVRPRLSGSERSNSGSQRQTVASRKSPGQLLSVDVHNCLPTSVDLPQQRRR